MTALQAPTVLYQSREVVVVSRGQTTEVRRAGRLTWSRYTPTTGTATVGRVHRSGRFLVSVPGAGIAFFASSGALVRSVDYPAYRDPRPLLPFGRTVVYATGVYNWIPWKPGHDAYGQMLWHDATRRVQVRDVAKGRRLWSSRSMTVGLPCGW